MIQDAVELVDAVIADDQLALAFSSVLYCNFGAQLVAQLILEAPDIRVY